MKVDWRSYSGGTWTERRKMTAIRIEREREREKEKEREQIVENTCTSHLRTHTFYFLDIFAVDDVSVSVQQSALGNAENSIVFLLRYIRHHIIRDYQYFFV